MKQLVKNNWRLKAGCLGDPIDSFTPREGEKSSQFLERIDLKKVCPSSCPVMKECARDALIVGAKGTVRAGVYLRVLREDFRRVEYQELFRLADPLLTEEDREFLSLPSAERSYARVQFWNSPPSNENND